MAHGKRLLRLTEVSERLGIAVPTMYEWLSRGDGPPVIRLSSRMLRFDEDELEEWLAASRDVRQLRREAREAQAEGQGR